MIIYHVPEADAGQRWLPTQDRANACARAFKAEFKAVHAGEDGRDGMCAMLNAAEMEIGERPTALVEGARERLEAPVDQPVVAKPDPSRDFEASEIEVFILERATVAQTEHIMAALACRFGELVKEKRG